MKYVNLRWGCALLLMIILISCKSLKDPIPPSLEFLPQNFTKAQAGEDHSGLIKPQDLFNDPFLAALIDSALANNLSLLQSKTSIQQLEADVMESRSMLFPSLGAYTGYSNRKFGLHTMDGAGNITTTIGDGEIIPINLNDFNLGLQASWEIDIWGKLKAKKKASVARLSANIEYYNLIRTALVEQVASYYFQLLVLNERKEILSRNLMMNDTIVEVIKAQKEAGRANSLSVQQFEALSFSYRSQILLNDQEIFLIESELRQLTGIFVGEIKRSPLKNNPLLSINLKGGLPSEVLKNRPDIRAAEKLVEAAKADLHAARAEFFPSLSINGNVGYQAYKTRFLFTSPESIAYGLFGNLMAPLVNRGAIKANFKRASSSQLEAYYNYQAVILSAYTEINNGLYALNINEELLQNKNAEMQLLVDARSTANELFNTNRASYLEVLSIQQNAIAAELELLELQQHQFTWKLYLYKALGGGWK